MKILFWLTYLLILIPLYCMAYCDIQKLVTRVYGG